MPYSYDRHASTPDHTAKMLQEVLRGLPAFRQAVQQYIRAAKSLDHEDESLMTELADPLVIDRFEDLAKHLIEAEKSLSRNNPHADR